jgi:hypothetical protein
MKKLNIILIDAFKPEYLEYAPYLSSLTKKYQWGELEVPFGHESMTEVLFNGKSDKIALFLKKENSSLKWTKNFSWLEKFGDIGRIILDCMINVGRLLKNEELFRTGKIPLKKLYRFDFSVGKPPFSEMPVNLKYFGELDKIGHKFGTKSKEIIETIKKIDKKISKINFDLIFSDHGMIEITDFVSVPETENCFIDSDMARYWGGKKELENIRKKLPLNKGKIINCKNKIYGELIFLANSGVLISPNYWQGSKKIKGMHGYNPKQKDMKGIYIINKQGSKKDIDTFELHKKFKQMISNLKDGRE